MTRARENFVAEENLETVPGYPRLSERATIETQKATESTQRRKFHDLISIGRDTR